MAFKDWFGKASGKDLDSLPGRMKQAENTLDAITRESSDPFEGSGTDEDDPDWGDPVVYAEDVMLRGDATPRPGSLVAKMNEIENMIGNAETLLDNIIG